MPGRSKVVVVTGIPVDADNWVYRRFVDSHMPSDEITFIAYDEISRLTESQFEIVKGCAYGGEIGGSMRDVVIQMQSHWDEEKAKRQDDGMRKQLESDRQHAKLDLPREATNRKARRAAAAAKRKRGD